MKQEIKIQNYKDNYLNSIIHQGCNYYLPMNYAQSSKDRNLELLKQMNKISQNMNEVTNNSNKTLYQNREKLENIDHKLDKINGTLNKSEDTAKEITSFWYYVKNKVKKALGLKKQYQVSENSGKQKDQYVNKLQNGNTPNVMNYQIQKQIHQSQQQKMTNLLLQNVKQAKHGCKLMGYQLDNQKPLIQRVGVKIDKSINTTQKINKILKKQLNH